MIEVQNMKIQINKLKLRQVWSLGMEKTKNNRDTMQWCD